MGGEGSMASAIITLRQNRAMLKRRKIRTKSDVYGKKSVTKLKLKQSSPQDIIRIRKKMKALNRKNPAIWFFSFVIFLVILYAFLWLFLPQFIGL